MIKLVRISWPFGMWSGLGHDWKCVHSQYRKHNAYLSKWLTPCLISHLFVIYDLNDCFVSMCAPDRNYPFGESVLCFCTTVSMWNVFIGRIKCRFWLEHVLGHDYRCVQTKVCPCRNCFISTCVRVPQTEKNCFAQRYLRVLYYVFSFAGVCCFWCECFILIAWQLDDLVSLISNIWFSSFWVPLKVFCTHCFEAL